MDNVNCLPLESKSTNPCDGGSIVISPDGERSMIIGGDPLCLVLARDACGYAPMAELCVERHPNRRRTVRNLEI